MCCTSVCMYRMVHVCFLRRSYLTSRCTQQRLFVAVAGKSIPPHLTYAQQQQ